MKRTLRIVPRALVAMLVTCSVALAAWVTITAVEGEGSKKLGTTHATVVPVKVAWAEGITAGEQTPLELTIENQTSEEVVVMTFKQPVVTVIPSACATFVHVTNKGKEDWTESLGEHNLNVPPHTNVPAAMNNPVVEVASNAPTTCEGAEVKIKITATFTG